MSFRGRVMLVVAAVLLGMLTASPSGALYASAPTPPAPVVTTVKPASGPVAGGTKVVVKGKNLTGAKKVLFGKVKGTKLKVKSATKLTVVAPTEAAGKVHVRVVTQGGKSKATKADFFTYLAPSTPPVTPPVTPPASPPSVTGVAPGSGSTAGGTLVTVSGANLTGATSVTFGGIAGTGLTEVSSSTLHVTSPAHAAGPVDVRVITPAGTSAVGATFTYVGPRAEKAELPGDADEDPGAVLNAVSCPETQACFAVGSYLSAGRRVPLVEQRTGADSWATFSPALPSDAWEFADADLADVDCASPTFCVAIGSYIDASLTEYYPLIQTWDGAEWTSENPGLPDDSGFTEEKILFDVDCPAVGSCVVVGRYDESVNGAYVPLVLELELGTWSIDPDVAAPDGSMAELFAVDCPTVSSCVAVGEETTSESNTEPLVFTGPGTWTVDTTLGLPLNVEVTEPRAKLRQVSCSAAGACVAVGSYFTYFGQTHGLVEVLGAGTWTPVAVAPPAAGAPNTPASNPKVLLTSVSCASTCAAVGQYEVEVGGGPATSTRPLLVTITGTTPTIQRGAVPDDAEGDPIGSEKTVTCTGGGRCLGMGFYEVDPGLSAPLLSALDAGVWDASAGLRPADVGDMARPLASTLDGSTVMSVGYYLDGAGFQQALLMLDLPI